MSGYTGNPIFGGFGGMQIVDSEAVGDLYEDWSQVRSHARAARRRKRGFPQRIVVRYRANGKALHDVARGIIYMHPHDRAALEQTLKDRP